jgi:uncharacterized membrane protein YphA (DoxX/SURF4 family)
METLRSTGRIFYGIAIAGLGLQTIIYSRFPYMMVPPKHSEIPGVSILIYLFGALSLAAGVCIILNKRIRPASLTLGAVLISIFVLAFIPYQLFATSDYLQLRQWENAEKELALAAGAFIIAGSFLTVSEILFALTMISFGILHFMQAEGVASYEPTWVPFKLFWAYVAGIGLLGSGIAIIFKVKIRLIATLLGAMILTWVIILHIPRVVVSPSKYLWSEVTSTLIALAYSGIAFVIAGRDKGTTG